MSRLVLYQWTQSAVSSSTSASRCSGPHRNGESSRTASVLYSPIVVSARALSKASPTEPIEGFSPARYRVSPEVHRRVLGGFNRSSQHLDPRRCGGETERPDAERREAAVGG